jgi:regulatory protein
MTAQKAYSYLVKILSSRDFSEYKLRKKLQERNYPASEIDEAINEIKARNFLREDSYIEARIKAFMNKGYSPSYIEQKLSEEHLKVTQDLIHSIFVEYNLTPEMQIQRLASKKMKNCENIAYEEQNKILRYLLSKGHDLTLARKILKLMILS